jgi:hypothetical protein
MMRMLAPAKTASKAVVNLLSRSRIKNRSCSASSPVHQQVAGLLGGPRSVGMPGHAQDVQVAVADLEHEQE